MKSLFQSPGGKRGRLWLAVLAVASLALGGCAYDDADYVYDSRYYPYSGPYYGDYGPYYGDYGPYYGATFAFGGRSHWGHYGGHHLAGDSFGRVEQRQGGAFGNMGVRGAGGGFGVPARTGFAGGGRGFGGGHGGGGHGGGGGHR